MPHLTSWVEGAFRWILQTTWQTTVLAGLIFLAQWFLRRRLAPGWRYGLWLLLVIRLLMPVVPPSGFSIFNLKGMDLANSRLGTAQAAPAVGSERYYAANKFNASSTENFATVKEPRRYRDDPSSFASGVESGSRAASGIDWLGVVCSVWLLGVLFLAVRLVLTNLRFRSRIERRGTIEDENVIRLFDECRREFGITRPVRLIESAEVESPGVYGIWRKWLLLPEGVFERFSREELRHTFLHEMAHLKRRDLEINWLTVFLQILHWFNPVIWLAFARMRADRELATDALVLAHVSAMDNIAYGETILKVVTNLANRGMRPGVVGIAESKAGLQERLRAIAGVGVAKHWTWAALSIAVIVAGAGLTGAQGTRQVDAATNVKNFTSEVNHADHIAGTVVDPHGRPVNGTQLAIHRLSPSTWFDGSPLPPSSGLDLLCAPTPRIFNPDFGHPMADLPLASEPWSYCTTDSQGRFYLNDLDRAQGLIAVQESGFALIATNGFSTNMTVKLVPWGRIEGSLRHYDEVVANEPVRVFFAYQDGVPSWGTSSRFSATTDGRGHFCCDFVPPGHFGVESAGMIDETVTVKSGQTAVVILGGSGRPVVGELKIRNPDGGIEAADGFNYSFFTSTAGLKAKTAEELKALKRQPIWESTDTDFHSRPVRCASDGTFRIDQVEPGNYVLIAQTSAITTPNGPWRTGEREVKIPATDQRIRKPLDLGVIEISLRNTHDR